MSENSENSENFELDVKSRRRVDKVDKERRATNKSQSHLSFQCVPKSHQKIKSR